MSNLSRVTFVMTTSDRMDLLDRTLKSFWQYYQPDSFTKSIIHEDSGDQSCSQAIVDRYDMLFNEILCPTIKRGYSAALDRCFGLIDTEYVYTTECDWDYHRGGFIEESMKILDENPDIHQVWIRDAKDHNHPLSRRSRTISGIECRDVMKGYLGVWNGFSLNPGLRRISDLRRMFPNGLAEYGDEIDCARRTAQFGYHAVSLVNSAIRHSGWNRHTKNFKV